MVVMNIFVWFLEKIEHLKSDHALLRIHSQCITGDVLESLKCDCGQQLKTINKNDGQS